MLMMGSAMLFVSPAPPEVTPSVPVTLTRLTFATPLALVDANESNTTFAPNAPEVETLIAAPVPDALTVLRTRLPTAPPLILAKLPPTLPTLKPRNVLSVERSTPLPALVVIVGAAPGEPAKVVYAAT